MPIEAVVFDIGRVLIHWDPEGFFDRKVGPERRQALFADVDLHGMNERVDSGADFRASVSEMAARHPEYAGEIEMWHDNWIEMASPAIDHSVELLLALKARGIPVFALTNFGVGTLEIADRYHVFLKEFDRRFVSGELKVMKPAPGIYELVERESGIAPERLLFTDDKPENIAAAAARGWRTHLFDGPEGWARALVEEGLLSEDAAGLSHEPDG